MANEVIIKTKDELSVASGATLDRLIKPLTHEILLFDSYVAGTGYVKDEDVFAEMKLYDNNTSKLEVPNKVVKFAHIAPNYSSFKYQEIK